jgi:hypothetical protein
MARDKDNKLMSQLPARYRPNFMDRLDRRTVIGRAVMQRYEEITTDLGGEESLSAIKRSVVRRFIWKEVMLEAIECEVADGKPVDTGSWTQLSNSWLGDARLLGLERKPKRAMQLHEYLAKGSGSGAAAVCASGT